MSLATNSITIVIFLVLFLIQLCYEHGAICICRCNNLRYPIHRPFFCDPNFCPSPPRSWQLPTYANDVANRLAEGSYRTFRPKCPSRKGLEYIDLEALESDGETSMDVVLSDSASSTDICNLN